VQRGSLQYIFTVIRRASSLVSAVGPASAAVQNIRRPECRTPRPGIEHKNPCRCQLELGRMCTYSQQFWCGESEVHRRTTADSSTHHRLGTQKSFGGRVARRKSCGEFGRTYRAYQVYRGCYPRAARGLPWAILDGSLREGRRRADFHRLWWAECPLTLRMAAVLCCVFQTAGGPLIDPAAGLSFRER
jgi:hypothetical protein